MRICALMVCLLLVRAASGAEFFVATNGDDTQAGTADQPFATIARAQRAVREMKERDDPIIVTIRGGTYFLDEPLTFEPADSGTEKSPVIYQAAGERVVISGGIAVTSWTADERGWWHAAMPEGVYFGELFVNDQRAPRPRMPAKGYYRIAQTLEPTEANRKRGADRFGFSNEEIRGDWAALSDVEVISFHRWTASRMRIASVDADQHIVTFTGPTRSTADWCIYEKNHRYLVENVREALGQPGQWYFDRAKRDLIYIPREGQTPANTSVIAPRLEQLVVFKGDVKQRKWVEHIGLRGLIFAHSNWTLNDGGESFPQAAINMGEAIAATGARHVTISDGAIVHTGGYAIGFGAGCRENTVERCEMVDLGAGGVKIGNAGGAHTWPIGGYDPNDDESRVEKIRVSECTIAHGGRIDPAAIGVWIGFASHNTIEHNDIFDFYYSGLSVGWTWGYAEPSRTHDNEVAFNDVHTLGQGVLNDMGGIYTLGVSPNTRIHHNIFRDIYCEAGGYGGWGLYTDEGSTGVVMDHNLVYNTSSGSFHQHYGKDNVIANNILVNSRDWQLRRSRSEDHRSFTITHNIIYWTNGSTAVSGNWANDHYDIDANLYFNTVGPVRFDIKGFAPRDVTKSTDGTLSFEEWQQRGHDTHSIVADPLFVDAAAGDFHLKPDSPATKIGFEPFDSAQAGRTTPVTLTKDMPPVPASFE
ncbi:MAG: hypothetical protein GC162_00160 [Planctomycetes bacterium]|nr:hypothetical protein [Planctomycetota bacterium]